MKWTTRFRGEAQYRGRLTRAASATSTETNSVNMHTPSATATLADEPNLAAALDLAAVGVSVFPAGPDKRPLLAGWQKKASTEPEQIRKWWLDHPDALASSSSTAIDILAEATASKPSTGL